ncbi:MAG: hypothetical protein FWD62_09495 [Betaproteobacteria bacterium]|nr:hypothetical protein [Betaproteobacteria bacterium]
MLSFSTEELERRANVWTWLARLFVAKEFQERDYRAIAQALSKSDYTHDELHELLRHEVAPVFDINLSPFNPVPEKQGWSRHFVRTKILARLARKRIPLGDVFACRWAERKTPPVVEARWQAVHVFMLMLNPMKGSHAI